MKPTIVAVGVISIFGRLLNGVGGFVSPRKARERFPLVLWAGKVKRRTAPSQSGGFGTSKANEVKFVDDYAIFPALEGRVRDTLVSAPTLDTALSESDDGTQPRYRPLPNEVYQRLDQIYGFPSFNYETTTSMIEATEAPSMLDLLAAPTASTDDTPSDGPDPAAAAMALALSRLPPLEQIRVLHLDPLVLAIDDFFTADECDRYVAASESKTNAPHILQSKSPTVGKDAAAKSQRTSTTFYHRYQHVPELVAKASRLLGLDTIDQWEEPQTVRYRRNEKFTWHLDALGPKELDENKAGQRVATLLVYLTSLAPTCGGATLFRDLGGGVETYLRVQPVKGTALLFFPAAGGIVDCPFDIRTLHSGEVVAADAAPDKWIAQLWLRQRAYAATAPPGNRHADALSSIADYCQ